MKSFSQTLTSLIILILARGKRVDALFVCPSLSTSRYRSLFSPPRPPGGCKPYPRTTYSPPYVPHFELYFHDSAGKHDVGTPMKSDTSSKTSISEVYVPGSLILKTGIASTLLGFIYAKFMKKGFKLLWKTVPNFLLDGSNTNILAKFFQTYPAAYIVLMTTCGGTVVAYLSSILPNLYSAHDYVHILSKQDDGPIVNGDAEKDVFPSSKAILPVLGLCLMTSLSGFSLGPEAPMVSAFHPIHKCCSLLI